MLARKFAWIIFPLMIGLAFFPASITGLWLLREWQETSFPIVDRFTIQRAGIGEDGALTMRGVFRKRFSWCAYQGTTWFVTLPDGVQERVGWDAVDQDPSIPRNRPAGFQSWGPWTVYVQKFPDADLLTGVVDHVCLAFWPTRTILGPISLPALRAGP